MTQLWAAEYNSTQKSTHIEPLQEYLTDCVMKVSQNLPQEWVLVGVTEDWEKARNTLNLFQKGLKG